MTERGPSGRPVLCTSSGDYARKFGGRLDPVTFARLDGLPYAAEGFFANGGARLYVVRVVGANAAEATLPLTATLDFELSAAAATGAATINLVSVAGLAVDDVIQVGSESFKVTAIDVTNASVSLGQPLAAGVAAGAPASFELTQPVATQLTAPAEAGDTEVTLDEVAGLVVGAELTIGTEPHTVAGVDETTKVVNLEAPLAADAAQGSPAAYARTSTTETTVMADAAAGATRVELGDVSGLAAGSTLTIDGDDHLVSAVDAGSREVTLGGTLGAAAAEGATVTAVHELMTVHAQWPGGWGNALRITTAPSSLVRTTLAATVPAGATTIRLATAFGLVPGSVITVGAERAVVTAVDTPTGSVTLASGLLAEAEVAEGVVVAVASQEFNLLVERLERGRVAESETHEQLSLAPGHPRYAADVVGSWDAAKDRPSDSGASQLVRLEVTANERTRALAAPAVSATLTGGVDDEGSVSADSYIGTTSVDPADRTGIQSLENEPAISIVAVPGQFDLTVQQRLVEHCEKMLYRFAVLDAPLGSKIDQARAHRQNFDSTRCAVYYPGLVIADSFGNAGDRRVIAPAGHVLGIYARTDITRGVHKAPANEVVRGVLGLETALTKGEQDILNPINVNCFRDFRSENRGLRLYGGRVATSNAEFRYINVRRLLLFIEQSLDVGLQWAVFEPNAEPLWDTVRQSISGFLTTVWRDGALEGTKSEQAFFVRIGYDLTMTQTDIDNGRLIAEIGVAPVKPAEFVIVRISQKTREAVA
ncbi:MAG: phage tail sheath family protein [Acidimicrobiia bacterium]